MRAVGASSRDVGFVFTGEGLMLGLTSWLFALPIGLSAGPAFVSALGQVIDFPAEYYPATHGVWIWLAIVIGHFTRCARRFTRGRRLPQRRDGAADRGDAQVAIEQGEAVVTLGHGGSSLGPR